VTSEQGRRYAINRKRIGEEAVSYDSWECIDVNIFDKYWFEKSRVASKNGLQETSGVVPLDWFDIVSSPILARD